jgi:hypothetical protein
MRKILWCYWCVQITVILKLESPVFFCFGARQDIRRRGAQHASLRVNHQNACGIVRVFVHGCLCVCGGRGGCVCAREKERGLAREGESENATNTKASHFLPYLYACAYVWASQHTHRASIGTSSHTFQKQSPSHFLLRKHLRATYTQDAADAGPAILRAFWPAFARSLSSLRFSLLL